MLARGSRPILAVFIPHSHPDTNGDRDHKYENDCVFSRTCGAVLKDSSILGV